MTGDVHSLDNEGVAQGQRVDPIAYTESQTNAFIFQDLEQSGLVQSFPPGIGAEWIGETGLERDIHFCQCLHTLVDVLRQPGWQEVGITGMAEGMQPNLHEVGVHTMNIFRGEAGQVSV